MSLNFLKIFLPTAVRNDVLNVLHDVIYFPSRCTLIVFGKQMQHLKKG